MEEFANIPQESSIDWRKARVDELRQTIARLNELLDGNPARYGSRDDSEEYRTDIEKYTAELEREEALLAQERAA